MTAPSTDRELLPCPFCGGDKVHVCVTRFDAEQRDAYAVSCRTRDCAGVIFTLGFGLFDSAEKAVAAWNRRADLTAAIREAALREAAKAAIEAVADCEGTIASQNFVAAAILALTKPAKGGEG